MTDTKMKSVPKVRFEGFTDDWEQRKVGELYKVTRGQVLATSKTTPEKVGKNQYPVYSSQTKNDGLMGYYSDYLFDTAITWTTDGANAGTVNFRPGKFYSTNVNGVLLSADGLANKAMAENLNRSAWKWVSHVGNPKLMNNVMSEISVMIPVNLSEQEKISEFLMMIDNTIALHQRKHDSLLKLKQAYLQKMFPKNGQKTPELRFGGFTDDWEQRKLTEIVNRVNKSSNSDVLPKVEFEDIVSGEGRLNKDISSKLDSRKGTLFESENILYGKLRPYLKNWLFPDFEGVALGDFWVFEATDVSVPSFDYYLIQSDDYQKVANDTSGTKMPRSDWKNVSSTDFAIPSKDEQKQIGAFFKQLDDTITLHQQQLDNLKQLKKWALQNLFV